MAFRRARMTSIAMGWSLLTCLGVAHAANPTTDVALIWTTPGDDGANGTATLYDMRYSMNLPITESNFYLCSTVPTPLPNEAGIMQTTVVKDLVPGAVYYFAMKTVDESGNWSALSNVAPFAVAGAVSTGDAPPLVLAFSAPMPNPARQSTRFELSLPQAAPVRVEAFDLTGRRVRSLIDGTQEAGRADVIWDLRDDRGLPIQAGVYLIRATLPGKVVTRRTVVVR